MKEPTKYLLLSFLVISLFCCTHGRGLPDGYSRSSYDSIRQELVYYYEKGRYDSLIYAARPLMEMSMRQNDTLSVIYTGLSIAQGFLFKENSDSLKYYLDLISPYREKSKDAKMQVIYFNLFGLYTLKTELDYSQALENFHKAYEWASEGNYPGHINDQISVLNNIVIIYYIRSDRHGLEYAQRVYSLSRESGVSDPNRCAGHKALALMYSLTEELDLAFHHITQAEKIAVENHLTSMFPQVYIIYGDLYCNANLYDKAERYYEIALSYAKHTDPGTLSLIYLNYGKCCEQQYRFDKAERMYKKGLEISYTHRDLEFRMDLLHRLADLYYLKGERNTALDYSRQYWAFADSVKNLQRDHEFNNQVLLYRQIQHDHEIQSKELSLVKAQRRVELVAFIMILVLMLSVFLWLLYKRQLRMYRSLVAMHNATDSDNEVAPGKIKIEEQEPTETSDANLFQRVEKLMREEEYFRHKDVSLEKVSERLQTNKTYLSKAINNGIGISFNNYINMYRIGVATRLLSDPANDIPLKQLADELGYNSLSVFYKAFQRATGHTPGNYRKEPASTGEKFENSSN